MSLLELALERVWVVAWTAAPFALAVGMSRRLLRNRPATRHALAAGLLLVLGLAPWLPELRDPGKVLALARTELATTDRPWPALPAVGRKASGAERASALPAPGPGVSPLGVLWLAGFLAFAGAGLAGLVRMRRAVARTRPAPPGWLPEIGEAARLLRLATPDVRAADGSDSPHVAAPPGAPRPTLVLPSTLWSGWDARTRRAVALHELAHLRRGDGTLRLLLALARAVHWWNPLAWWLSRVAEEESERACDAWVTSVAPTDRFRYANALLDAQALPRPGHAVALSRAGRRLKGRLRAIADPDTRPRPGLPGRLLQGGFLVLVLASCFATIQVSSPQRAVPSVEASRAARDWQRALSRALLRGTHPYSAADVPELVARLDSEDPVTRREAADDLGNLLEDGIAAVPHLLHVARTDPEPGVRREAIDAIGRIGPAALPQALDPLSRSLTDPNARVRREAADVLGRFGALARPAGPALREALADEDRGVRREARHALDEIGD